MHYPVARMALESGFNVMSDKPMTVNLKEALALQQLVRKTGLLFGLTHNYTGYPMVKEARELVHSGKLGKVRKVVVEYPQGWLASRLEGLGQKQAGWRTDPKQAGASCCMGDIGTHCENLAEYITGLQIDELCADLTTFVKGRKLEDDGNVLLRFKGGARGVLYASQISVGEENPLRIRVYGEKGGLEWRQEEPNTLILKWPDQHRQLVRAGVAGDSLSAAAKAGTRLPAGHPEGFIEAFANLYRNYAQVLSCRLEGKKPDKIHCDFPGVGDGVRGMAFIAAVVESSKSNRKWMKLKV
jgi:predicted dehydrogenase